MKNKGKKLSFIIVFALMMSLISISFAKASSATSETHQHTIGNYIYSTYAMISTDSTKVTAGSTVSANGTVPTGYIGASNGVWESFSGRLVSSSSWIYNPNPCGGMTTYGADYYTAGTYFSRSYLQMFNGSYYEDLITGRTPNIQLFSSGTSRGLSRMDYSDSCVSEIKTNKNGKTYGSSMLSYLGEEPDLVSAYGVDGKIGYVYSEDLNYGKKNNPSDCNQSLKGNQVHIPLYDKEGENVIGSFIIDNDVDCTYFN